MRACEDYRLSPSEWLGLRAGWDAVDRAIVLAWRAFKASQLCSTCGTPWAIHEQQTPADFATGWLECPAAEQVARARAAWAHSPQGEAETEAARKGAADPREWRQWIHWPAAAPAPTYAPLD